MANNLPRGLRNNNPLNIKRSNSQWIGKIKDNTDGTFEQFDNMIHGYRAALYLIRKYINVYQCNTLYMIINRWAPPVENIVAPYVKYVSNYTCVSPFEEISFNEKDVICSIVLAMASYENGVHVDAAILERQSILFAYDLLTSK